MQLFSDEKYGTILINLVERAKQEIVTSCGVRSVVMRRCRRRLTQIEIQFAGGEAIQNEDD
jgi:hypothetical protein